MSELKETRFAIRFPDGTFSDGPSQRPTTFDKAKLWKHKGHIKQHIGQYHRKAYPFGTEIVEVEVIITLGNSVGTIEKLAAEEAERKRVAKARSEASSAMREYQAAQKRLAQAKARVEKLNDVSS